MDKTFTLELGDIIQITTDVTLLYVINYIDNTILELINVDTTDVITFPIISNKIQHSNIIKIGLMYRNTLKGFALQHNLLPKKGIIIGFNELGELLGEILELQNDIITILLNTYELIYINFKFQGLPHIAHLPQIEYIRSTELSADNPSDKMRNIIHTILKNMAIDPENLNLNYINNYILDNNPNITNEMMPYVNIIISEYLDNIKYKSTEPIPNLVDIKPDNLKYMDLDSDTPLIGISQKQSSILLAEINEADNLLNTELSSDDLLSGDGDDSVIYIDDNLVYNIDEQTTDLLDDLLSTIPYENRTIPVLNKIHTIINRYIQLRQLYIHHVHQVSELIDNILNLNLSSSWLIPMVNHTKQLCNTDNPDDPHTMIELENAFKFYNDSVDNRYKTYLNKINSFFSSFYINSPDEGEHPCITELKQLNKELLVANVNDNDISFVKYIDEIICQTGMLILPNYIRRYNRIWKPMMSLLETVSLQPIYLYNLLPQLQINTILLDSSNLLDISLDDINQRSQNIITKYIFTNNSDYKNNIHTILKNECNILKYLTDSKNLSICRLINKLDIYDIYYFNIKYDQYLEVNQVLTKNIYKYKKQYTKKQKIFTELLKSINKLTNHITNNPLCNFITNRENLEQAYNIKPCDDYTSSEFITHLNKTDYSILFRMYILYNTINSPDTMIIPDLKLNLNSTNSLQSNNSEDVSITLSVTPINKSKSSSSDCKQIEVVKIYLYLEDLMSDNNIAIYTDTKSREVISGDYAILFENSINILYYKRFNNKWSIDILIPNTYIYDSPYMLCNNNLTCYRDYTTQTCLPIKTIIKNIIENIHNEIDPYKQMVNYTQELLESYFNQTIKLGQIYTHNHQKNTKIKYTMGTTREFNDVIISPYLEEFINIIGEPNFKKRQESVLAFCNSYTRIYNNKNNMETVHWRYCIKTDVNLVPTSIYNIAILYNTYSGDISAFNYNLELLKKDIGIISEDGDYIIDQHSGFKISEILFNYDEGYSVSGFKNVTHEILNTDEVDNELDQHIKQFELLMDTEYSKTIRNIIGYVSDKMNINLQNHIPFIIRHVVNGLLKEPKIKKNKTLHDVFLMFLTLGLILISIQINIPNIKSNKPFPNCKESFIGFPLTNNESDIEAIEYISCIILFAKQPTSPWKILHKYNKNTLTEQLITFLKTYILNVPEITNKLQDKLTYLSSNKEIPIPFEHNIEKWVNFMPNASIANYIPKTYNILSMSKINDILNNPSGFTNLHILSILYHLSISIQLKIAYIIIKNVNKILLKTKSGQPYVENSCCIEHDNYSTLMYFINEDSDIRDINDISIKISHIYNINLKLTKGSMFSSLINTARPFPNIITPYLQNTTIYAICINNLKRSKDYNNTLTGTIYENIKTLNDTGLFFSEKEAIPILNNKFLNTITTIPVVNYIRPIESLYTHINYIHDLGLDVASIYNSKFIDHILPILKLKLDNNSVKFDKDISTFRTYLSESIKIYYTKIKTILTKVNQRSNAKHQLVLPFLDEAHPQYLFTNFVSPDMYINSCKELFINMSHVFPNIIIHKNLEDVDISLPKYWNISNNHSNDLQPILKFKYNLLSKFYSYNELMPLLHTIILKTQSFMDTLHNSQYISMNNKTDLSKTLFDATTTQLLFKYYIYLLTHEILIWSTDVKSTGVLVDENPITNAVVLLQQSAQYIHTCFEISVNTKTIINKEVKSVMDSIINIKNIEKNILLTNLGKLTDDEHMSNKVLKILKLKRWSVPKNLRSYTKSGYDADAGIYDEDDAFNYNATEYDVSETLDEDDGNDNNENDNNEGSMMDLETDDIDLNIDLNWDDLDRELPDDLGDTIIEDGDYYNISTL